MNTIFLALGLECIALIYGVLLIAVAINRRSKN